MAQRTSIHSLEQAILLLNETVGKRQDGPGHFRLLLGMRGYSVVQRNAKNGWDAVFPWDKARFILACITAYEQGYKEGSGARTHFPKKG